MNADKLSSIDALILQATTAEDLRQLRWKRRQIVRCERGRKRRAASARGQR